MLDKIGCSVQPGAICEVVATPQALSESLSIEHMRDGLPNDAGSLPSRLQQELRIALLFPRPLLVRLTIAEYVRFVAGVEANTMGAQYRQRPESTK